MTDAQQIARLANELHAAHDTIRLMRDALVPFAEAHMELDLADQLTGAGAQRVSITVDACELWRVTKILEGAAPKMPVAPLKGQARSLSIASIDHDEALLRRWLAHNWLRQSFL